MSIYQINISYLLIQNNIMNIHINSSKNNTKKGYPIYVENVAAVNTYFAKQSEKKRQEIKAKLLLQ